MSNYRHYNDPAFPEIHGEKASTVSGLTRLEWFAGMAVAGLLANPQRCSPEATATQAFDQAKAMCDEAAKRSASA